MRNTLRRIAIGAAVCVAATGASMAQDEQITGTAQYRERIAVLPGSVLEVELLDISRADAPARTLSLQQFSLDGIPKAFSLAYDPELIDPRFTYSVSARILSDDRVLFRTDTVYPVLTRDAGYEVALVLVRATEDTPSLVGTTWRITEIDGQAHTADEPATMEFLPDNRVAATAGCNRFAGGVRISGTSMSFLPSMAGTLMACPPPLGLIESRMTKAMSEVTEFTLEAGQLTLLGADGQPLLRMVAEGG